MGDLDRLQRWHEGDEAAGRELVERHMAALDSFVRSIVPAEVDDLIQRTWLSSLESVHKFRAEGSFRAFLFAIARHEVIDHFRRVHRDSRRFDPGEASVVDLAPSPSRIVVQRREHRLLLEALRQLPLDDQILLELSYWEGLNSRELSVALDTAPTTIRSRLARARQKLTATLERLADGPSILASTTSDLDRWATSLRDHVRDAEGIVTDG